MKGAFSQASALVLLSLILGVVSYYARPEAIPWETGAYEIELEEALSFDRILWVDARAPEEFAEGHLGGAVSLHEEDWEAGFLPLLDFWEPGSPIVVYCSSQACLRSFHVAERLRHELGVEEVYTLAGGWKTLQEGGLAQ